MVADKVAPDAPRSFLGRRGLAFVAIGVTAALVLGVVLLLTRSGAPTVSPRQFGTLSACHCGVSNFSQKGQIWLSGSVVSPGQVALKVVGVEAHVFGKPTLGSAFLVDDARSPGVGVGVWTARSMPGELQRARRLAIGSTRLLPGHHYSLVVVNGLARGAVIGGYAGLRILLRIDDTTRTKGIDAESYLCLRSTQIPSLAACYSAGRPLLAHPSSWVDIP